MTLFLAEDSPADVFLIEYILAEKGIRYNLQLAKDGEAALSAIREIGGSRACPDLAILDVNLPKADGFQLLAAIRVNPACSELPVIILTSSESPRDRKKAEEMNARFCTKPAGIHDFDTLVEQIQSLVPGVGKT